MKVKVTFNLDNEEDKQAVEDLIHDSAKEYQCILNNIRECLRSHRKYGFPPNVIENIRKEVTEDVAFAESVAAYLEQECLKFMENKDL